MKKEVSEMRKKLREMEVTIKKLVNMVTTAKNTDNDIEKMNAVQEASKEMKKFSVDLLAAVATHIDANVDVNMYINDIDVQQKILEVHDLMVAGEEVPKALKIKLIKKLNKAKLGLKPIARAKVVVDDHSGYTVNKVIIHDRTTVFDILKERGVISGEVYAMMLLDRDHRKVQKAHIREAVKNFVVEYRQKVKVNNKVVEQMIIPVAPKAGANRIIVKKSNVDKPIKWMDVLKRLAVDVNADAYVNIQDGKVNAKKVIKIGIMMNRAGTVPTVERKFRFRVVDMPEADGVVAYFRPGTLYKLFKDCGWNPAIGFQGTLFNAQLGMYAKGTFAEIPRIAFDMVDPDVDMIINADAIAGNAVVFGIKTGTISSKDLLVMNNVADYSPRATLNRQFISYRVDSRNHKAVEYITRLIMDQLIETLNGIGGTDGKFYRLLKAGFDVNSSLVAEDRMRAAIKSAISNVGNVNMKKLGMGDSFIAVGVPTEIWQSVVGYSTGRTVKHDDVDVIVIPRDSVICREWNLKVGDDIVAIVFKNPTTPTVDAGKKYRLIVGDFTGGMAYMHADAPHRLESGHDFDGDNIVVLVGEIVNYMRNDKVLPALADIKLEENDWMIEGFKDFVDLVATQMDTPIGIFEAMLGRIYGKWIGDTVETRKGELKADLKKLAEFLIQQVQGYINAQKKLVDGLVEHNSVFSKEKAKYVWGLKDMRGIYKMVRNNMNDWKDLKDSVNVVAGIEDHKLGVWTGIISDAMKRVAAEMEKFDKLPTEKGTIETTIYHMKAKRWITGEHDLNLHNLLYAVLENKFEADNYKEIINVIANVNDYWSPLNNLGKLANIVAEIKNTVPVDTEEEENALSRAFNEFMFGFNALVKKVIDTIVEDIAQTHKIDNIRAFVWVYAGQKMSDSAFLNVAPKYVLDAIVETYNEYKEAGKIHEPGEDDPTDPDDGNEQNNKNNKEDEGMNSITFYVDGSYSSKTKKTGWGLISEDGKVKAYGEITDPELVKTHQVAGELKAAMMAISYAKKHGYKKVIIKYDYKGLEEWATGVWKTKSKASKLYKQFIDKVKKNITIEFVKVNAADNPADELARIATGAKYAH